MCISYTYMYVYTQTDTDRHVILNVSMPRAPHSLPEHYHTPVSQQQPLHCVVIQAKYVTGVTFFPQFFPVLGPAKDVVSKRQGTISAQSHDSGLCGTACTSKYTARSLARAGAPARSCIAIQTMHRHSHPHTNTVKSAKTNTQSSARACWCLTWPSSSQYALVPDKAFGLTVSWGLQSQM